MSVLDGFFSTWSNAKATFGQGTPQTGDHYDGSAKLAQMQSTLDSAAPDSRRTGGAASTYGTANTEHRRVIGEIVTKTNGGLGTIGGRIRGLGDPIHRTRRPEVRAQGRTAVHRTGGHVHSLRAGAARPSTLVDPNGHLLGPEAVPEAARVKYYDTLESYADTDTGANDYGDVLDKFYKQYQFSAGITEGKK